VTSVVVIEDQVDVREALGALIDSEPDLTLVGTAAGVDEGIGLARLHRPDIALVDFKLPGGGGPRAAREILMSSPTTKVIALSAYADRNSVYRMLEAGAVSYLVKGAAADEIAQAIARALVGQSVISPEVGAEIVAGLAGRLKRESESEERTRERRARIEAALAPKAITMAFQPIVTLSDRNIEGYEALARFSLEPARPPDQWFAEAKNAGLGAELELAAVTALATQIDRVPAGLKVGVNMSPEALLAPGVCGALCALEPNRLVIEITEHAPVFDYGALLDELAPLRRRGALVAIDDVGSGFASLRHILQIAPDFIKLDASVSAQIETRKAEQALTIALVEFARELDIHVIAEGIESEATADLYHALGVTHGQGYHFGRPGPLPGDEPV
jgi:EAL domain-containing protein (putative c-di-GMP-specific phosphodiesterase class I)/DNA-binding NarL/FixJ family response regulator